MTTRRHDRFRAEFERSQTARRSARAKTSEVLGPTLSRLSERALLRRQRAARNAIQAALANRHGSSEAGDIAFHLLAWFEEAAFLVALQLDLKRFSKAEVEASVSGVLAEVLDHVWEAARVAGMRCRASTTRLLIGTTTMTPSLTNAKAVQDDMTPAQLRALRRLVQEEFR